MTPSVNTGVNGSGRREQKKRDTRTRLIRAAQELFVAQGYDETSMEEIAKRAGVSRRTCFRYFPSKEALAFPYREQRLAAFHALIHSGPPEESAYDAVKRACLVMAGEYMAQREEMVVFEQLVRRHPVLRARERENDRDWEAVIAGALARDHSDERQVRLLSGAMMGLIRAGLEMWLESGGALNLIDLAQRSYQILDRGVPALLEPR